MNEFDWWIYVIKKGRKKKGTGEKKASRNNTSARTRAVPEGHTTLNFFVILDGLLCVVILGHHRVRGLRVDTCPTMGRRHMPERKRVMTVMDSTTCRETSLSIKSPS